VEPTDNRPSVGADALSELTENFAQTAQILFAAGGVTETLAQLVESAVTTIEGCDFASIFLLEGRSITRAVQTDPIVDEIDSLQCQTGEGPCLDAIARQLIFYADDLELDPRWPIFGPSSATVGVRSVLALPLSDNGAQGALNLYGRYPAAFGVVDRAKAVILASLANPALAAARSLEDNDRLSDNLHTALSSRELIGQAEGILMERERITGDQAFDILRRASQHLNIKLREVAQKLVDTGERPDTGHSRTGSSPSTLRVLQAEWEWGPGT
jgi:hypothetical protein